MMGKSLKRSFVVYTLSNLLSTGLPFILLPFLTNYLSLEDYGILSNFTGLFTLLIPVIGVSFVSAYTRQYYRADVDIELYTATGINLQAIIAVVIFGVLLLSESWISSKTGIDEVYIRLVSFYCLVFSISEIVFTEWRIKDKLLMFTVFRVGRTLLEVSLTIIFVIGFDWSYKGRILGIILATSIFFLFIFVKLVKSGSIKFRIYKIYLIHMLKFGVPLIPHVLGAAFLAYSDKIIVTDKLGLAANGVYSVAFQVGLIIGLVQNSFNQAWVPWFYDACSRLTDTLKQKIVRNTYYYYIGLAVMTGLLYLATPYIFLLIGKDFKAGSDLVIWVAIGFLFNGMYKMKVNYLFYMEKTLAIAVTTVIAAGLNIVLNLILIDIYGLLGAAIATAFTFFVQFIIVWYLAQKAMPMPWFKSKE